jgi:hypothetical protein
MCPFKYLTNGVADVVALVGFLATLPVFGWMVGVRSRLARTALPLLRRPTADA